MKLLSKNLLISMTSLFLETSMKNYLLIGMIFRIGRTRGYAFVYLKNAEDADKLIEYVDGRHIRSR